MASIEFIHKQLKMLNKFIQPLLPLSNCHITQYFTEDQWNTLLNNELRKELSELSHEELSLLPTLNLYKTQSGVDKFLDVTDSLKAFVHLARSNMLDSLGILTPKENVTVSKTNEKIIENCKSGMSSKKAHEVPVMTDIISSLCKDTHISWVVDLGSGVGYLSSALANFCNLKVLAVDSSSSNIDKALQRNINDQVLGRKLENSLKAVKTERRQQQLFDLQKHNNITPSKIFDHSNTADTSSNNLIGVTKLITDDENLLKLIKSEVGTSVADLEKIALVGLHTCGNLSSTSLKLFVSNSHLKFLCNIGCCYHLLNEEFSQNHLYIDKYKNECSTTILDSRYNSIELDPYHQNHSLNQTATFPMSLCLKEEKCSLGRNARMLATNAPHRINTSTINTVEDNTIFWRALFQIIVVELNGYWPENAQVGRKTGKKSKNFINYCRNSLKHIGISLDISNEVIENYYEKYRLKKDEMTRFFILKSSLGPIIEGIILLDRLAFLYEQGFRNSHIVQLFDNFTSPRCMAIIALK